MILRCTAKLLKLLGVRPASVEIADPELEDDWYANLLWFDRRKCVLITHASTLFPIFVADIRKSDLAPIGSFVVNAIEAALRSEDLPPKTFGALEASTVRIAKTSNRVVLGVMNDQALLIHHDLMRFPSLASADLDEVNHRLRRTINSPNGARYPIDLAADRALRLRGMSATN